MSAGNNAPDHGVRMSRIGRSFLMQNYTLLCDPASYDKGRLAVDKPLSLQSA